MLKDRNVRKNIKGDDPKMYSHQGYVRHCEYYLKHGDWIDDFYGEYQEKELSGDITPTKWIKSITPKGDVSWYVKWIASVFIIFGMMMTSLDVSFYPTNLYFHFIGVSGLFVVGF